MSSTDDHVRNLRHATSATTEVHPWRTLRAHMLEDESCAVHEVQTQGVSPPPSLQLDLDIVYRSHPLQLRERDRQNGFVLDDSL
eukprot:CAMPEP_0175820544 /NCGR_PEP_ID=MMETSP0107_2-20121207/8662_1 /TAXON_ID=195067 ORGANISM="Goniomonas pacifica, Strain CCMP1869" /NCGR_SAMPLE_ID=MMETSP0107_2 /ASSEMBLY_ACC=CAM_ASM_000203 /LENGTH=83 /DNA_ID=CAMNT_0017132871 /DNA_START=219 /DNA_END=468 /DNA_ORIENTATION=+